jgi:hypothetical protein
MSLYTDIVAEVLAITNRPTQTSLTDMSIRQAVLQAHRSGKWVRDLVTVTVTGLSTAVTPQVIDLSVATPRLRRIAAVKPTGYDLEYSEALVDDLFDHDKYPRKDIYWGIGTSMYLRPQVAVASVDITFFQHPTILTAPIATLDDWIAEEHKDLIVCWAAANVLATVGEQEIKTRYETLAATLLVALRSEALQLAGA